jgi:uncharacterized surface protein with fasciclin (FAS1) repeats
MKTLIDTAADAGNFSTLLSTLSAAALTDTLRGAGPFTVFAPTDAAFKKLPAGTVEALLEDLPKLKSILMYHVAAGKIAARDVKSGDLKTLGGSAIVAGVHGANLTVDGVKVVTADIVASNGIIHVIDTVLTPKTHKLAAVA